MATQTEYVIPAPAPQTVTITVGTSSRQWMTPQGGYVNEIISGGGGASASQPVVFTAT